MVVSIDELNKKIKNLYHKKNYLVNKVNDLKLDIEVLEIIRETEIKRVKGEL